jgi:hypothetical protein
MCRIVIVIFKLVDMRTSDLIIIIIFGIIFLIIYNLEYNRVELYDFNFYRFPVNVFCIIETITWIIIFLLI